MYPSETPGTVDLGAMVQWRLGELTGPNDLFFPARRGGWARRSNYGRNLGDPACEFVGWPKNADGECWYWTFHSLRAMRSSWSRCD